MKPKQTFHRHDLTAVLVDRDGNVRTVKVCGPPIYNRITITPDDLAASMAGPEAWESVDLGGES